MTSPTTPSTPPTPSTSSQSAKLDETGSETESGLEETVGRISREEKKLLSRRRILDAAREVFFREGFMLANLDEVATLAGVAKGTLYRYFESKADLYVAVLAENGQVFVQKMNEVAQAERPVRECLRELGDFYLDHWSEHIDYFQIFWAIDNQSLIGGLPDDALREVSNLWEGSLSILKSVLDRGVAEGELSSCDTWEVSYIMWTMANGLIQSEYTAPRKELRRRPLREVYRDAIDLLVLGLSQKGDKAT
ncbi:MAG: TetR/AcrR family transcriptional regulator [Deltaproteobacteria bacterium]|nr:TetR/AcrR family transcriptional regulator [Deltaproteobacteria bacterium]MBW2725150.1 TetR/AcrR family transcriptional regulator [Deltaproteobacteria bacterium]